MSEMVVPHVLAIRLTYEINLSLKATRQAVHAVMREAYKLHFSIIVWTSTPCTSGSPWQRVNEALGHSSGDAEMSDTLVKVAISICLVVV